MPILAILLLALFLRVYRLDVLPPGLHYDEAFNGTQARDVLRGVNRPIFFTGDFGEEPLHIYTEAILFALVGESPWTIRLTSAFFGVIFVAAVYGCVRAWFPARPLTALAAAVIAATLYWSINFSRIGIETNGLAMMVALSAASLGFAYRHMTWTRITLAGVMLGGTLYTYLAARLWLPAVALWFVYLVVSHRSTVRAHFGRWLALGLAAVIVAAPLVLFFIQNPIAFAGRSAQVFTPETFATNLARTALMFFANGDLDPRDNLPGRAALDPVLGFFFVIGLMVSVRHVREPRYAFVLIWLVVMALPSALTEFAPNFRRAIGAMPAAIVLCAVGVEWLLKRVERSRITDWRVSNLQSVISVLLATALLLSAWWSVRAYFVDWASSPGLFYSFDAGILRMARELAGRPSNEQIYISPKADEHPTVLWAMNGREFRAFDGRSALVLGNSERAATYGIITFEDAETAGTLTQTYRAQTVEEIVDDAGKPYAAVLSVPAGVLPAPAFSLPGTFRIADWCVLAGWQTAPPQPQRGKELAVELAWSARAAAPDNYTVFLHLAGPVNPSTGSSLWAQDDSQPGRGTYPTREWRAGETVLDRRVLKVPPEAPPGEYRLQVGMYLLDTGVRVPVFDSAGVHQPGDQITLGTIRLH